MITPRKWENGDFSSPRPLCFCGWPTAKERPHTFNFDRVDFCWPREQLTARLYYRVGWTALVFWNGHTYFADEILTFEGMLELVRARFAANFYLQAEIKRDYVE